MQTQNEIKSNKNVYSYLIWWFYQPTNKYKYKFHTCPCPYLTNLLIKNTDFQFLESQKKLHVQAHMNVIPAYEIQFNITHYPSLCLPASYSSKQRFFFQYVKFNMFDVSDCHIHMNMQNSVSLPISLSLSEYKKHIFKILFVVWVAAAVVVGIMSI